MDQINGTANKKQVLFSIGSYKEREKRVINKISTNGLFSLPTPSPEESSKSKVKERPVSFPDVIDAPKKFQTLPSRVKKGRAPPIPIQNGLPANKPICPPSSDNDDSCRRSIENGSSIEKPTHPPTITKRSMSMDPEQFRQTGKVALTIAAYEGEPRTPTRLEFLQQPQRNSRSSSKASSSDASTPLEDTTEPIASRLQSELVATLRRSNLGKRNDLDENEESDSTQDDNEEMSEAKAEAKDEIKTANGNVKKLADVLVKKLVFTKAKCDEQISDNNESFDK